MCKFLGGRDIWNPGKHTQPPSQTHPTDAANTPNRRPTHTPTDATSRLLNMPLTHFPSNVYRTKCRPAEEQPSIGQSHIFAEHALHEKVWFQTKCWTSGQMLRSNPYVQNCWRQIDRKMIIIRSFSTGWLGLRCHIRSTFSNQVLRENGVRKFPCLYTFF